MGEGGVDTGGPRRDFFRILAEQCRSSAHAEDHGSFFACNTSGYQVFISCNHGWLNIFLIFLEW